MAGKRIFISYSRGDTAYVSSLVEALRKQGFEVWFDKNIRMGTDWDDTIEEQLKAADAVVLVLSRTSVASENVKDEVSYAIGLDKSVNPIKIEECEVPMRLARKQFVDFTTLGPEAGFKRLVADLRANLKVQEEEKPLSDTAFTPPNPEQNKMETQYQPPKRQKRLIPYIIGGVVAVGIFVFIILQCGDTTFEDVQEHNNAAENTEMSDNVDWEEAVTANTVDAYIKYIRNYGKDENYGAAMDSIGERLPMEGLVKYWDANGVRYFTKILYTDVDGNLAFGQDNNEMPRANDLVSAVNPQEIYSTQDRQLLHGESIINGQRAMVYEVANYADGSVWVTIWYAEN